MEPGRVQRARALNPSLASVSQDAPVQASPCLSPAWLREGGSPGGGGPVRGGAELEKPAGLERCGHRLHSSTWRLLRDTHPHALPPRGWEQKSSPRPGLGGGEEGWALSPGVGRQGDEETEGQRQRERERQGPREGKRKRDTHGAGFRLREAETRAGNRSGSPVGSPFKIHQNPARVPSTCNQGVRAPSVASRLHLPPLGPLPTRGRGARCFQVGPKSALGPLPITLHGSRLRVFPRAQGPACSGPRPFHLSHCSLPGSCIPATRASLSHWAGLTSFHCPSLGLRALPPVLLHSWAPCLTQVSSQGHRLLEAFPGYPASCHPSPSS
nr:uncharacterized protein LOC106825687 [Equus asinus]XP_044604202.1 uncharacterized protein LOC106825687 [Equus asinus]XP_044604203.1 uncharacterized protein LOC106825687 [Equus asinus]